jgi:hypothetical protein
LRRLFKRRNHSRMWLYCRCSRGSFCVKSAQKQKRTTPQTKQGGHSRQTPRATRTDANTTPARHDQATAAAGPRRGNISNQLKGVRRSGERQSWQLAAGESGRGDPRQEQRSTGQRSTGSSAKATAMKEALVTTPVHVEQSPRAESRESAGRPRQPKLPNHINTRCLNFNWCITMLMSTCHVLLCTANRNDDLEHGQQGDASPENGHDHGDRGGAGAGGAVDTQNLCTTDAQLHALCLRVLQCSAACVGQPEQMPHLAVSRNPQSQDSHRRHVCHG